MPIKLVQENVDIYINPIVDIESEYKTNNKDEYTLGDLHGNAIKLLYFLIKHGIVKSINAIDYDKLVNIYKKPVAKLTKQDLNLFNDLIKNLKCTQNPQRMIRFIGDELADRGSNDYFTLKILQRLHEQKIRLEILLSNHSAEFIKAYELQQINPHNRFHSKNVAPVTSMTNLQILIDKKLIDKKEVFDIYKKVYKPNLKLIAYTEILNKDKTPEIVLYTHAPVGLETIKAIADDFELLYKNGSLSELTNLIDKINNKFQQYVKTNNIRELFEEDAFFFILWNRNYHRLQRPQQNKGFKLSFVHGHDTGELSKKNIYNLDSHLGKCGDCNKGEYLTLLVTQRQSEHKLQIQTSDRAGLVSKNSKKFILPKQDGNYCTRPKWVSDWWKSGAGKQPMQLVDFGNKLRPPPKLDEEVSKDINDSFLLVLYLF